MPGWSFPRGQAAGHVPGAGPISRNRKSKEISSELVALNADEYIQRCSLEVLRLYDKKVAKKYETRMVLLISFSEFKLNGLSDWSCLYESIKYKLSEAKNSFVSVYLFNEASNEVYQVA